MEEVTLLLSSKVPLPKGKFFDNYVESISNRVKELKIEFSKEENTLFNEILKINIRRDVILTFPFVLDERVLIPLPYNFLKFMFTKDSTPLPTAIELTLQRNPKFFLYYFFELSDRELELVDIFVSKFKPDFSKIEYTHINKLFSNNLMVFNLLRIFGDIPFIRGYANDFFGENYIEKCIQSERYPLSFLDSNLISVNDKCKIISKHSSPFSIPKILLLKCWNELKDNFIDGCEYSSSPFRSGWVEMYDRELSTVRDAYIAIIEVEDKLREEVRDLISLYPTSSSSFVENFLMKEFNEDGRAPLSYLILKNVIYENTLRMCRLGLSG